MNKDQPILISDRLKEVLRGNLRDNIEAANNGTLGTEQIEVPQSKLKEIYDFQKAWKKGNPGHTQRQFKRAFAKRFPNYLS